jgi:hypothetical protein
MALFLFPKYPALAFNIFFLRARDATRVFALGMMSLLCIYTSVKYYFSVLFLNHHLELFALNSIGCCTLSQSGPALMVFFG